MRFEFKELGSKKVTKTVVIALPLGESFYSIGFDSVLEFMISEVAAYMPEKEKKIECVPIDGYPSLMSGKYVVVYNGLRAVGSVSIFES